MRVAENDKKRVIPLPRWINYSINIPNVGQVTRSRDGKPVEVSSKASAWLIRNYFAKPADETELAPVYYSEEEALKKAVAPVVELAIAPSTTPTPEPTSVEPVPLSDVIEEIAPPSVEPIGEQVEESVALEPTTPINHSENPAPSEDDDAATQEQILAFLNSSTAEEIKNSIKGIGETKSAEVVGAKPLTWDRIKSILSERQIDAVIKFLRSRDAH